MQASQEGGDLPSIREVINAGGRLNNTYAMKEYEISEFDGKKVSVHYPRMSQSSDFNRAKNNNFIDTYKKSKAFLPAPNKYENVQSGYGFKVSSPTLYKASRKTEITEVVANATKASSVGPGSHNPKPFKPKVQGTYGGLERQTYAQVVINELSNQIPTGKYDLPSQVSRPTAFANTVMCCRS